MPTPRARSSGIGRRKARSSRALHRPTPRRESTSPARPAAEEAVEEETAAEEEPEREGEEEREPAVAARAADAEEAEEAEETYVQADATRLYLKEIGFSPLLTAEEEVFFARKAQKGDA